MQPLKMLGSAFTAKLNTIVKCYYNFDFQHRNSSLQCHMILQKSF